jgi:hypothetical protein
MRFAEVFLRLGTALVGWMLLYAHFLWLAVLRVIGCGPDGDKLHQVLLGVSILTIGASFAIRMTRPLHEVHAMLRWLAVPLAFLLPWILMSIWTAFRRVSLDSTGICSDGETAMWQLYWAPLQLLIIALVGWSTWSLFRDIREAAR